MRGVMSSFVGLTIPLSAACGVNVSRVSATLRHRNVLQEVNSPSGSASTGDSLEKIAHAHLGVAHMLIGATAASMHTTHQSDHTPPPADGNDDHQHQQSTSTVGQHDNNSHRSAEPPLTRSEATPQNRSSWADASQWATGGNQNGSAAQPRFTSSPLGLRRTEHSQPRAPLFHASAQTDPDSKEPVVHADAAAQCNPPAVPTLVHATAQTKRGGLGVGTTPQSDVATQCDAPTLPKLANASAQTTRGGAAVGAPPPSDAAIQCNPAASPKLTHATVQTPVGPQQSTSTEVGVQCAPDIANSCTQTLSAVSQSRAVQTVPLRRPGRADRIASPIPHPIYPQPTHVPVASPLQPTSTTAASVQTSTPRLVSVAAQTEPRGSVDDALAGLPERHRRSYEWDGQADGRRSSIGAVAPVTPDVLLRQCRSKLVAVSADNARLRAAADRSTDTIAALRHRLAGTAEARSRALVTTADAQMQTPVEQTANAASQTLLAAHRNADAANQTSRLAEWNADAGSQTASLALWTVDATSQTGSSSVVPAHVASQTARPSEFQADAASQVAEVPALTTDTASQTPRRTSEVTLSCTRVLHVEPPSLGMATAVSAAWDVMAHADTSAESVLKRRNEELEGRVASVSQRCPDVRLCFFAAC